MKRKEDTEMGSSKAVWKKPIWCAQPLTPLMEGPDPELQEEGGKKERSWELIREWFRVQKGIQGSSNMTSSSGSCNMTSSSELRLLLGVLGCPLAPIPIANDPMDQLLHLKDIPLVGSNI